LTLVANSWIGLLDFANPITAQGHMNPILTPEVIVYDKVYSSRREWEVMRLELYPGVQDLFDVD